MARTSIRPVELMVLIAISISSGVQTLTRGSGVAESIANAAIGFLAGLGTLLLVRKVRKIVKKRQ